MIVTFEQAKELRKLGFNYTVQVQYLNLDALNAPYMVKDNRNNTNDFISAPSYEESFTFLRHVYNTKAYTSFTLDRNDPTRRVHFYHIGDRKSKPYHSIIECQKDCLNKLLSNVRPMHN
jgi:hypothetical protein